MGSSASDRLRDLGANARVEGESFAGMDLSSLRPGNIWFDRCDFAGADLRLATLDQCFFRFCDFTGSDLTGASMRGAVFAGCNFTDANLSHCDLRGARMSYVNTGAVGGLTVLTGARWEGAIVKDVVMERVVGWTDP